MNKKPAIIGLTGSIGMGKSVAAKMLRKMGCAIHNADEAVHELLGQGGAAVKKVAKIFPATLRENRIDRAALGKIVFGRPRDLRRLEKILHPLVRKAEIKAIVKARKQGKKAIVLDIPLLFETGAERRCDATICMTASAKIQRARVLKRPGMTQARFKAILSQQMPDREKRRRADFVVRSDRGLRYTEERLRAALKEILDKP